MLVVTGGHRVDLDALLGMVAALADTRGWVWAHAVQPSAQDWLDPRHADAWDALLLHDLPGLHLRRGEPPRPVGPEPEVAAAVAGLLERGVGVVATHHALAGWPAWDGWADALGGRFHYAPGPLHGQPWPSSGTRITGYTARVVAPDHPVCAGLDDFALTDELYCCPVFEDRVVPLSGTTPTSRRRRFVSTYEHVAPTARTPRPTAPATRRRATWWRGRPRRRRARSSTCSRATAARPSATPATGSSSAARWTG